MIILSKKSSSSTYMPIQMMLTLTVSPNTIETKSSAEMGTITSIISTTTSHILFYILVLVNNNSNLLIYIII